MQRYGGVNLSPKSKHTYELELESIHLVITSNTPGIVVSRFGYVRTADLAGDACASQVASDLRDAQCIPTFFHEPISREEFETASPHFRSRPRAGNAKLGCLGSAFPESLWRREITSTCRFVGDTDTVQVPHLISMLWGAINAT